MPNIHLTIGEVILTSQSGKRIHPKVVVYFNNGERTEVNSKSLPAILVLDIKTISGPLFLDVVLFSRKGEFFGCVSFNLRRLIPLGQKVYEAKGIPGVDPLKGSTAKITMGCVVPFINQPTTLTSEYAKNCKTIEELSGTLTMLSHKGSYLKPQKQSSPFLVDFENKPDELDSWCFYVIQVDDTLYMFQKGFPLASLKPFLSVSITTFDFETEETDGRFFLKMFKAKQILKFSVESKQLLDYWFTNLKIWKQRINNERNSILEPVPSLIPNPITKDFENNYLYVNDPKLISSLTFQEDINNMVNDSFSIQKTEQLQNNETLHEFKFNFGVPFAQDKESIIVTSSLNDVDIKVLNEISAKYSALEWNPEVIVPKRKIYDLSHRTIFTQDESDEENQKLAEPEAEAKKIGKKTQPRPSKTLETSRMMSVRTNPLPLEFRYDTLMFSHQMNAPQGIVPNEGKPFELALDDKDKTIKIKDNIATFLDLNINLNDPYECALLVCPPMLDEFPLSLIGVEHQEFVPGLSAEDFAFIANNPPPALQSLEELFVNTLTNSDEQTEIENQQERPSQLLAKQNTCPQLQRNPQEKKETTKELSISRSDVQQTRLFVKASHTYGTLRFNMLTLHRKEHNLSHQTSSPPQTLNNPQQSRYFQLQTESQQSRYNQQQSSPQQYQYNQQSSPQQYQYNQQSSPQQYQYNQQSSPQQYQYNQLQSSPQQYQYNQQQSSPQQYQYNQQQPSLPQSLYSQINPLQPQRNEMVLQQQRNPQSYVQVLPIHNSQIHLMQSNCSQLTSPSSPQQTPCHLVENQTLETNFTKPPLNAPLNNVSNNSHTPSTVQEKPRLPQNSPPNFSPEVQSPDQLLNTPQQSSFGLSNKIPSIPTSQPPQFQDFQPQTISKPQSLPFFLNQSASHTDPTENAHTTLSHSLTLSDLSVDQPEIPFTRPAPPLYKPRIRARTDDDLNL